MGYNYDKEFLGEPFNVDNLITEARERGVMYERIKEEVEPWPSTNVDRMGAMAEQWAGRAYER